LVWMNIVPHVAKSSRYTIGARIENKFLDLLELAYAAYFTEKEKYTEKLEKVSGCILILDTLKFFSLWLGKEKSFPTGNAKMFPPNLMKSEKCLAGGKIVLTILKRKTAIFKTAGRKFFRRRNTNSLSAFHLLPGLSQLLFNHKPSSLRSRLKMFGLPLRSVSYSSPSYPLPAWLLSQKIRLYFIWEHYSASELHQVFSFFENTQILFAKP